MTMGQIIGQKRRKLGLTQEALAKELGVTNQAVSKWELDQSYPDMELLPRLADIFSVSVDALFDRAKPEGAESHPTEEKPESVPMEVENRQTGDEDTQTKDEDRQAEDEGNQAEEAEPAQNTPEKTAVGLRKFADDIMKQTKEMAAQLTKEYVWKLENGCTVRVINRPKGERMEQEWSSPEVPDWDDDDTIRVVVFQGRRYLKDFPQAKEITFHYEGEAANVVCSLNLSCGNVEGDVNAGMNVACQNVEGDVNAGTNVACQTVEGDISAGNNVSCGSVGGDVQAGSGVMVGTETAPGQVEGDVNAGSWVSCANVGGDVNAGGDVECGKVGGDVEAGSDVNCGQVGGDVDAGNDVSCGQVGGDVDAGDEIRCGDVGGDVDAGGDVTCGKVEGDVDAGGNVTILKNRD